ncbi:MAG: hypothetical protein RL757_1883 [Bacteroidota bacterium]
MFCFDIFLILQFSIFKKFYKTKKKRPPPVYLPFFGDKKKATLPFGKVAFYVAILGNELLFH